MMQEEFSDMYNTMMQLPHGDKDVTVPQLRPKSEMEEHLMHVLDAVHTVVAELGPVARV